MVRHGQDDWSIGWTMDKLKAIESFVRVARLRSFAAAAEQLGTSPGLVSRRVSAIEKELKVPLLTRTTRNVALTEYGAQYLQSCEQLLIGLESAETRLAQANATVSGSLRVMVPKSFGATEFADAVLRFCS